MQPSRPVQNMLRDGVIVPSRPEVESSCPSVGNDLKAWQDKAATALSEKNLILEENKRIKMQQDSKTDFQWGPLGADWWLSSGRNLGLTDLQIRYACESRRTKPNWKAAKLAGSAADGVSLRTNACRLGKHVGVIALVAAANSREGVSVQGKFESTTVAARAAVIRIESIANGGFIVEEPQQYGKHKRIAALSNRSALLDFISKHFFN